MMVLWLLHGVMTQKTIYMAMPAILALKFKSPSFLYIIHDNCLTQGIFLSDWPQNSCKV